MVCVWGGNSQFIFYWVTRVTRLVRKDFNYIFFFNFNFIFNGHTSSFYFSKACGPEFSDKYK